MPDATPLSPIGVRFARLSTSTKMLIILTLALLPLSLIASLASMELARTNRANRVLAAHLLAGDSADRLTLFFDRSASVLRSPEGRGFCRRASDELGGVAAGVRVGLTDARGLSICTTPGLAPNTSAAATAGRTGLSVTPDGGAVRFVAATPAGLAVAEVPRAALGKASHPNALDGSYDLRLVDRAGRSVTLATGQSLSFGRSIVTMLPVAGGDLRLVMTVAAPPLSANELLLMLLPLLMWAAGAAIGWLVVDRLVLRPLAQLQLAIDRYRTGGGKLALPVITTPAHEIRVLGDALSAATATITRHETDLEDGLARQTRLTREVHHRVKNNLQVVASLLNIHARGAQGPEAAAAYGTIQRRVDALALVHRSHFAELEVNRGLALRPLIGELAANLRGSAPAGAACPRILLDLTLSSATQDVAVPVAFLVTELVELAMLRVPGTTISITLAPPDAEGRARLSICSQALRRAAAPVDEAFERGERVVGGLARQLRSRLEADDEAGIFAVDLIVMPEGA